MPVALSSRESRGFQVALASLLSPLDHASSEAWLAEASRQTLTFLGADQALTMVPLPGRGEAIMTGHAYDLGRTVTDYRDGVMRFDTGLHVTRQQLGLEVYHQRHVYQLAAFHRNPVYGDWAVPHRLMDVIGMGYNPILGAPVAAMHFYHDQDHGPEDPEAEGAFGARGLALLQLLLPAWKAGVRQHLTFSACREGVAQLVDRLDEGVALYDLAGRERHRNSALGRLLAADPQGAWLGSVIRAAARRLCRVHTSRTGQADARTTVTLAQKVSTARGWYALETSQTNLPGLGPGLAILVVVRLLQPSRLSAAELMARFRLTSRECEVARLLADGRSNLEIATALEVTRHTARRHTEAVLRKLALRSRAQVGPALKGDTSLSTSVDSATTRTVFNSRNRRRRDAS